MPTQYDYLIVGAGLYGAVCAREALSAGKKVLVIDADMRKSVIAGRHARVKNPAGLSEILTGIVKLMEEKGYLTRQSVQGDARLKKLSLTPKGLEHHQRAMAAIEQVEADAVLGLTPEEINLFHTLCTRIRTNLSDKKE